MRLAMLTSLLLAASANADFILNTNLHSDLEVAYDPLGNRLSLGVHFDDFPSGMQHFAPHEVTWSIYSPLPLQTTASPIGPMGYVIPSNPTPGLPLLGIAGAEEPGEELTPYFTSVRLEFLGMTGSGQFALWQDDGLGGFLTYADSTNGFTSADFAPVALSGHDDFQWGFNGPGTYTVFVRASGVLAPAFGGGNVTSDVYALNFDATSTPVPPTALTLGLSFVLPGILRLRKRK